MFKTELRLHTITPHTECDIGVLIEAAYTKLQRAVELDYYNNSDKEDIKRYIEKELNRLISLVRDKGNSIMCVLNSTERDKVSTVAIIEVVSLKGNTATIVERYHTGLKLISKNNEAVKGIITEFTRVAFPGVDKIIELSDTVYDNRTMFI